MKNYKGNLILTFTDQDTGEVYQYESWNPNEYSIDEYLQLRGHTNYKITF
tara:strand:+ start:201 stop:350 length:150 start_codon:yes stop_codon:yes gene_type:complete